MFDIIRNASVEFHRHVDAYGKDYIVIVVDKKYRHTFKNDSNLVKRSKVVDHEVLNSELNGGTYVFNDGELVDYRFSTYNGFIHDEFSLNELGRKIGFSKASASKRAVGGSIENMFEQMRHKNGIFLGGPSKEPFSLDIEGMGEGGSFKNRLIYRYSPFDKNIETTIEAERLICSNGMVGMSSLITNLTPVISDVESNLEVIEFSLRPKINDILSQRFLEMSQESNRASIHDIKKARNIIQQQLESTNISSFDYKVLKGLMDVTNFEHIKGVFNFEVFKNDSKSDKQAPSHLTYFDLFNIMTEMSSHVANSENVNREIQFFINNIVFDNVKKEVRGNISSDISEHSNPDRVFFGRK